MLGRQAWRLFQQPTAIWSQLFKGLYFKQSSFQNATLGYRPSWGWQSILKGRDAILPKLRWLVGDGSQINIRADNWLSTGKIGGQPFEGEPLLVADILNSDNSTWKQDLISNFFNAQVCQSIFSTPINSSMGSDQIVWTETTSGDFSVKSCYHYLSSNLSHPHTSASSSYQNPAHLWKKIWHMTAAPKIKVFMWLACKNSLATRANLFLRHITPNPNCSLCNQNNPETLEHLFFYCPWTRGIWNHQKIKIPISLTSVRRLEEWVASRAALSRISPSFEEIAYLMWETWRQRNDAIFRQKTLDPTRVVENALINSRTFKSLQPCQTRGKDDRVSVERQWKPPTQGTIKCNVDGSFIPGQQHGTIACIYRNHEGHLTDMFTATVPALSAFQVEIFALIRALQHLINQGFHRQRVQIESDCLQLVEILRNRQPQPWNERHLFHALHDLLSSCPNFSIRFACRDANLAADWAAKAHRSIGPSRHWLIFPPPPFVDIILSDAILAGCKSFPI